MTPEMIPDPQCALFGALLGAGSLLVKANGKNLLGAGRAIARRIAGTPAARTVGRVVRSPVTQVGGGVAAGTLVGRGGNGAEVPAATAATPVRAMAAEDGMLPLTVPVMYEQRAKVPRGYVTVTYGGQKVGMLKGCARDLGLWKPRPRPLISAREGRAIREAARVEKKVKRVASRAGFVCRTKKRM